MQPNPFPGLTPRARCAYVTRQKVTLSSLSVYYDLDTVTNALAYYDNHTITTYYYYYYYNYYYHYYHYYYYYYII